MGIVLTAVNSTVIHWSTPSLSHGLWGSSLTPRTVCVQSGPGQLYMLQLCLQQVSQPGAWCQGASQRLERR